MKRCQRCASTRRARGTGLSTDVTPGGKRAADGREDGGEGGDDGGWETMATARQGDKETKHSEEAATESDTQSGSQTDTPAT